MPCMAAVGVAVWKAPSLSGDYSSCHRADPGTLVLTPHNLIPKTGYNGVGTIYYYQWAMDSHQDSAGVLRRSS